MMTPLNDTMAYFSLGSNLGDRKENLELAMQLLGKHAGFIENMSGIYESPAWGYSSHNAFYNCCLGIRTTIQPVDLMETALKVEFELGRIRSNKGYADRIIDIDLLLYGDLVMEEPGLTLPHPAMNDRRFVLVPLAEIVPYLVHPVSGITISAILERCPDQSDVTPL